MAKYCKMTCHRIIIINQSFKMFHSLRFHYDSFTFQLRNISSIQCKDISIIGGGIIGTSIANKLKSQYENLAINLIEKDKTLGNHQSSHNSGVMHSGIYYKPESMKAKLCVRGLNLLQHYCDEKEIRYKKCGKLIVANNDEEIVILNNLLQRGRINKVKGLELLKSPCEIRNIALGCRGVQALWCPQTANVNFKDVLLNLAKDFEENGGEIIYNFNVKNITESHAFHDYPICLISTEGKLIYSKYLIICAGLQASSLTSLLQKDNNNQTTFVPFKVYYQQIDKKYCDNLETNIYSVPDLNTPFLGHHFSPVVDNKTILLGPYAVPSLSKSNDGLDINYITKLATSSVFQEMISKNFCKCIEQASKAVCPDIQTKHLQKLMPNFSYQYVEPGQTAIQCQLLNKDGTFVSDFIFDIFDGEGINKRVINMRFTPSPAATSCLAIAEYVAKEFNKNYGRIKSELNLIE